MRDYKLDNDLKDLSATVYEGNENLKPAGWIKVSDLDNKLTGFHGEVFCKGNQVAIVFRGTELKDFGDVSSDISLFQKKYPFQLLDARCQYEQVKKDFPNQEIVLAGHSLGGSLAQTLGVETGEKTVTFNAYGVANILKSEEEHDNITNYGNLNDPIFGGSINKQVGETYIMNNYKNDTEIIEVDLNKLDLMHANINYHFVENMGDITKSNKYENILKNEESDNSNFKMGVELDVDYKDVDPKRVLTVEEFASMSKADYKKNEDYYKRQVEVGNVMKKEGAEKERALGNLIWVEDYTRADGTKVSGYYRRK